MRSRWGSALALALGLVGSARAADPYVVDLVRALREWGSRVGIPTFVVHDIAATHTKEFLRVWRDLGIAEGHGFGSPGVADAGLLDEQAALVAGALSAGEGAVTDPMARPDPDAKCTEPPAWTPPPRPRGWRPTPREWVRDLQRVLAAKGHYHEAVDGLFGPATRAAVYAYQCAEGLPGEGLTRDTAKALGVTLPR